MPRKQTGRALRESAHSARRPCSSDRSRPWGLDAGRPLRLPRSGGSQAQSRLAASESPLVPHCTNPEPKRVCATRCPAGVLQRHLPSTVGRSSAAPTRSDEANSTVRSAFHLHDAGGERTKSEEELQPASGTYFVGQSLRAVSATEATIHFPSWRTRLNRSVPQ